MNLMNLILCLLIIILKFIKVSVISKEDFGRLKLASIFCNLSIVHSISGKTKTNNKRMEMFILGE